MSHKQGSVMQTASNQKCISRMIHKYTEAQRMEWCGIIFTVYTENAKMCKVDECAKLINKKCKNAKKKILC